MTWNNNYMSWGGAWGEGTFGIFDAPYYSAYALVYLKYVDS